jgi:microsomal dipeptidase-like Zn-dependent dipeptidase/gamma-glutamyl-gamma-aminobutyrate hydrolase PuuD
MKPFQTFDIEADYEAMHRQFQPASEGPLIGLTGNYADGTCKLLEGYYASIRQAGGTPVIIPPTDDVDTLLRTLDALDGLLLTGGADINPLFLGEEPVRALSDINPQRDRFELLLTRLAADRQVPILGICRGIQVMNAAFGGTLYQDIYSQATPPAGAAADASPLIKHSQQLSRGIASHSVTLTEGSLLRALFGTDRLAVNTFHHQAVKEAAPGFRVTARSADGIVEAIESTEFKSMVGVQWHPECFILEGDESMRPLFSWFIGEALSYRAAKRVHREVLTFDSHCDTPMFFQKGVDIARRDPQLCVDLHKMTEGRLDATLMVAYLKQEERTPEALLAANRQAHAILDEIEQRVGALHDYMEIARTPADLYRLKAQGKKAVMMGVENGYAIGLDLKQVEAFRRRGIVYMTLCHNGNNDICGSARFNDANLGVSAFGQQVIAEMNRVGMMVDLSHAGERSFYDALEMSRTPIVCSHSSARALCDHPRNLTDDQMRALARRGGVAQVTLYSGFLRQEGEATIVDAMAHLRHMVDVMGVDHVGIGTDFDGDGGITGCQNASELIQLTRRMLQAQFTQEDIRLLWGGNFLRVMQEVQQAGTI